MATSETTFRLSKQTAQQFQAAALATKPVAGLTHDHYKYPARFSPTFARQAIKAFTSPGDTVLDPFMGGGTTLVEACSLGRQAIGTDISSLAVFVAEAKTTTLAQRDIEFLREWTLNVLPRLKLRGTIPKRTVEGWTGYQRNLRCRRTSPICRLLERALLESDAVPSKRQRNFVRCALLRTGQWALDCRSTVPTAGQFRERFAECMDRMFAGSAELSTAIRNLPGHQRTRRRNHAICLQRSAVGIETEKRLTRMEMPKLVLTSPPYPGVHVVYHRWQINGRKETPAPFWLADSLDGMPESFYTFGSRHQRGLTDYFATQFAAFDSIAKIVDQETLVVQMVAFSDATWQLSAYLDTMAQAGFREIRSASLANSKDGRLWRTVPNRKWYASQRGPGNAAQEVVLFHRKV